MSTYHAKLSITSLVAFFLVVALYAGTYFALVSLHHSPTTGSPMATYPAFVGPLSIVYRPVESIDRRIRADLWTPNVVGAEFRQTEVTGGGVINRTLHEALEAQIEAEREAERR